MQTFADYLSEVFPGRVIKIAVNAGSLQSND